VRILLEGGAVSRLHEAAAAVKEAFRRGENLLSPFLPASALSKLCREAGEKAVCVGPVLGELLRVSRSAWEGTKGAFDPTVAPLVRAFRLNSVVRIPSSREFLEARERVGMGRLEWDPEEARIRFPGPGFRLDPCGVGKGLVLDLAVQAAREAGAEAGLLEAGGDLRAFGPKTFLVGLRVKGIPGGLARVFPLQEKALAASGLGERPLHAGKRELGHVVDPATGRPLDPEDRKVPLTAAVTAPSGALADALATGLLVRGEVGLGDLAGLPGVEGLVVLHGEGEDFVIRKTPGFPSFRRG